MFYLENKLKNSILYLPSLCGLSTFALLAFIFQNKITEGFAWINSIACFYSLVNLAILYTDDESRREFVNKHLPYVLIFSSTFYTVYILIYGNTAALITLFISVQSIFFIAKTYVHKLVNKTIIVNIFFSIMIPLSSVVWVSSLYIFFIFPILFLFSIYIKIPIKKQKLEYSGRSVLLKVFAGLALQAPIILFPFFDSLIVKHISTEVYIEYFFIWKIINGIVFLIFTRKQFFLSYGFYLKKVKLSIIILLYVCFIIINYKISFETIGIILRCLLLSLLISYISIYIRTYIIENKINSNITLLNILLYFLLTLLFIVILNFYYYNNLELYLAYLGTSSLIPVILIYKYGKIPSNN